MLVDTDWRKYKPRACRQCVHLLVRYVLIDKLHIEGPVADHMASIAARSKIHSYGCRLRRGMGNLRSFPFDDTKCPEWEERTLHEEVPPVVVGTRTM